MTAGGPDPAPDLARLVRWQQAGGLWQVVARRPGSVTVALLRCDGGEEMDRFSSTDAAVLALVAGAARSDRG